MRRIDANVLMKILEITPVQSSGVQLLENGGWDLSKKAEHHR